MMYSMQINSKQSLTSFSTNASFGHRALSAMMAALLRACEIDETVDRKEGAVKTDP